MKQQSTPFPQSRPYAKNYFTLIKEYEKNKATLLKEEPKKPIVKLIEDIYNKYSSNLESYIQKNKGKLQLYGSTKYENASIEAFILELQSYKQTILKQIKSNPFVSANMNHQMPSEEIILTPLPDQPRKLMKEKKEKEEFDSAERTAVVMRIVEYTHRLKKETKTSNPLNNGQKGNQKEMIDENRSVFIVLKKAVNVIQIWWKKNKRDKSKNMKANRFVWLVQLYIKRKIINQMNAIEKKSTKQLKIIEKQKDMNIVIQRYADKIKNPLVILRNKGSRSSNSYLTKRIYRLNNTEKQMKMATLLSQKIKQMLIKTINRKKHAKVKVIMKNYKKPIATIAYEDKVLYSFTGLLLLQQYILQFLTRIKVKKLKQRKLLEPIILNKTSPQVISKIMIKKANEQVYRKDFIPIGLITKQVNCFFIQKTISFLCFITKETKERNFLSQKENTEELKQNMVKINQKNLSLNICFISKEVKADYFLRCKTLLNLCLITKDSRIIQNLYRKELIQISSVTKEVKFRKCALHKRDLPQLCKITKETKRKNQYTSNNEISSNPFLINKIKPLTLSKVITLSEEKQVSLKKTLIDVCFYSKKRIQLSTKLSNRNIGVNTDTIIQLDFYQITKEFEYSYLNYSSLIHSLSYVLNNHFNEYFINTLRQHTHAIKKEQYLHRVVLVRERHDSLLVYFRQWQHQLFFFACSHNITCEKSKTYTHNFEYKSAFTQVKSKKLNLYRLSLGFKLLPYLFFQLPLNKLKLKSIENKCIKFIYILSNPKKKEIFYRVLLKCLISNSIDINRKSIVTLLKYGLSNQYQSRLNQILKLNLTENNYDQTHLTFPNYIREIIGKEGPKGPSDANDSLTEKESISGDESNEIKNIPDEISQLYLCRNKNKKCITSPDASEDENLNRRKLNDYCFTPTRNTNKTRRYNSGSKRIFPKKPAGQLQNTIILRNANIIDLSII